MSKKKIVVLYSGGLDSYYMYTQSLKEPDNEYVFVYYKHGSDAEKREISILPHFVDVRDLPLMKYSDYAVNNLDPEGGKLYIPGRNLLFCVAAACQELPDEIWLGANIEEINDVNHDKNDIFKDKLTDIMNYVFGAYTSDIVIRYPIAEKQYGKLQTIKELADTDLDGLLKSRSCYSNTQKPCGLCKQCFKRFLLFTYEGIHEEYNIVDMMSQPVNLARIEEYRNIQVFDLDKKMVYDMLKSLNYL